MEQVQSTKKKLCPAKRVTAVFLLHKTTFRARGKLFPCTDLSCFYLQNQLNIMKLLKVVNGSDCMLMITVVKHTCFISIIKLQH